MMLVREVLTEEGGRLSCKCPEEILRVCGPAITSVMEPKLGEWP